MNSDDKKFLIQILREGSLKWRGRSDCLKKSRVERDAGWYKNGKEKIKVMHTCAHCKKDFDVSEIEIDHIAEIGSFVDWNSYIPKLFCGVENLQSLCRSCHRVKTINFNRGRR